MLGNRAAAQASLGRHEEALADARQATKVDPTYVKGFYRQAMALIALNRPTEAAQAAMTGLKLQPNNNQMKELLIQARNMTSQTDMDCDNDDGSKSDDDIEEELEDDEEEEKGDVYDEHANEEVVNANVIKENKISTIGNASDVVLDTDPPVNAAELANAAKEEGTVKYKAGQYDAAVELYSRAMQLAPENATYCLNRSAAFLMLHKNDQAVESLTTVHLRMPTHESFRNLPYARQCNACPRRTQKQRASLWRHGRTFARSLLLTIQSVLPLGRRVHTLKGMLAYTT